MTILVKVVKNINLYGCFLFILLVTNASLMATEQQIQQWAEDNFPIPLFHFPPRSLPEEQDVCHNEEQDVCHNCEQKLILSCPLVNGKNVVDKSETLNLVPSEIDILMVQIKEQQVQNSKRLTDKIEKIHRNRSPEIARSLKNLLVSIWMKK